MIEGLVAVVRFVLKFIAIMEFLVRLIYFLQDLHSILFNWIASPNSENLSKLRTPSPESASMGLILYLRLRNIINEVILSLAARTINDTAQHILAPKLVTILGIAKRLQGVLDVVCTVVNSMSAVQSTDCTHVAVV